MPAKPDALGLKVMQHRVNKAERQGRCGLIHLAGTNFKTGVDT